MCPDKDKNGSKECTGCGGDCEKNIPAECRGPRPVPWLTDDRTQYFYEARSFVVRRFDQGWLVVRVTYQHRLELIGRQQGGLLFTVTLLPGESVDVYESNRYRRVRAVEERMSVHTSFRQTVSALSQARRQSSMSAYSNNLTEIRTQLDTSVSVGGGLPGLLGGPVVNTEFGIDTETSLASGSAVSTVTDQFTQNAITAAQATESERSVVVSTFEDDENAQSTRRTLRNENPCHAVTYFVRRVMEAYTVSTRVQSIEWAYEGTQWRSIDDLTPEAAEAIKQAGTLPAVRDEVRDERRVTLPTDGTLYEPELAHCSSCDPMREARLRIELELERIKARRACLEAERLDDHDDDTSAESA